MSVIAFIDDNPAKIGAHVQGIPVVGSTKSIATCVTNYNIEQVIIALPSASLMRQKQIMEQCNAIGVDPACTN
jgi:FlaA1/EpsC-like NDP-sugar epimerase